MKDIEYLNIQFKRLHKIDLYFNLAKFLPIVFSILLSPFLIIELLSSKNYSVLLVFSVIEVMLIYTGFSFGLKIFQKKSFVQSNLYKCLQNNQLVNKIIVSKNKILFDIIGLEDEIFFINQSDYKNEIITSLKKVFGETKVIIIN